MSLLGKQSKLKIFLASVFVFFNLLSFTYAEIEKVSIRVDGLSCPFCVYGLEKKIKEIDEVRNVSTDFKYGVFHVRQDPAKPLDLSELFQTVKKSGFTPISAEIQAKGVLSQWRDKPALLIEESKQIFLLVPKKGEAELPKKLQENQGKKISLKGVVHPYMELPPSLQVLSYEFLK